MRRLRILTWHIHGGYLYYLTQTPHEFFIPFKEGSPPGYVGVRGHIPWGPNVHEVPAEEVRRLPFDAILFQWREHYTKDQHEILSEEQRRLPKIYLEHDPPQKHPTFTRHVVDDPNMLLVHVTPFNALMWNSGRTPTRVIEHGVRLRQEAAWTGQLARGLVVVNNLLQRGRRLGADIFDAARREVPLDLVGMGAEEMGGLREVLHGDLPVFESRYRFFFNPIRYTSLGLAVIEAMMVGLPIIGLATTEMVTAVENGVSGYVDTRVDVLIERMKGLLADPGEALRLSQGARRVARERFGIERFIRDWNEAFALVTGTSSHPPRFLAGDPILEPTSGDSPPVAAGNDGGRESVSC